MSACTQDLVDAWLDEGGVLRSDVYTFLTWTSRNRHTRPLTVPLRAPSITGEIIARTSAGRWSTDSSTTTPWPSPTRWPACWSCCSPSRRPGSPP